MRLRGARASRNVEDRRGMRGKAGARIGGIGVIVVLVIGHVAGIHVSPLLQARFEGRGQAGSAPRALTVRIELQADCPLGAWARGVEGLLEPGDIEEALNAARQIGDDALQRRAGWAPQPHIFTHGTSDQRQCWFATGYRSGALEACDTFGAERL